MALVGCLMWADGGDSHGLLCCVHSYHGNVLWLLGAGGSHVYSVVLVRLEIR